MTNRQRVMAIMHYQEYDKLPIVGFGYWTHTLEKWAAEGHLTQQEAATWKDGNPTDMLISEKLGFDFNWSSAFGPAVNLRPAFKRKVVKEFPDGSRHVRDEHGAVVVQAPGATGIPSEISHLLKGRKEWEEHFLPRLQFCPDRVNSALVNVGGQMVPFDQGGMEHLLKDDRTYPYGLHCGSLYGTIRDWLGLQGACYLYYDDEDLFDEIIQTVSRLCYDCVKMTLATGAKFDFAHFWEDICFKNGPLINPSVFDEKVGPHYRRITDLLRGFGVDIVSLDCDGMIDTLIPTWFNNGVNTMFPIEVGTWNASLAPWREKYGRQLRGVGGMNKTAFAKGRPAVDAEIERLIPLVALGGYIPCPDHRIAPDAEWDTVRYYCDRMREVFA